MLKSILYLAATIISLIALFYIATFAFFIALLPIAFLILLFSTYKPRPRSGKPPRNGYQ